MGRSPRRLILPALLSAGIVSGGCASSGGVKPSPFPALSDRRPPVQEPRATEANQPVVPSDLLRTAYDLRGVSYRLGGETPGDGFDCSGFVRYVFGVNHLSLPRTVQEQYSFGSIVDAQDVHEGDLVFFSTIAPGPSHVGIAVAPGLFIHAPGANGAVRIERLDTPYWHNRLVGVRRVL